MAETYSRIAVVTGASSGIGEATVRRFVAEGLAVVGNARSAEKLAALEGELGAAFVGVTGDAGDAATVSAVLDTAVTRFGAPADLVVVNAGRGLGGAVTEVDLDAFEEVQRLNVTGAFRLMQKAARQMVEAQVEGFPEKAADIVVIGSVVGRNVSPFSAAYGATKFAVHSLTEALRREVGPKGVRVSLVEPGFVLSGFQDAAGYSDAMVDGLKDKFGPFLVSDDIADAIYYIISRPPHIAVGDLLVRPTRQDYP